MLSVSASLVAVLWMRLLGRQTAFCLQLNLPCRLSQGLPSTFRRSNILGTTNSMSSADEKQSTKNSYQFGPFQISPDHVFYSTSLSAAFVNLRPIVPGHVLVMPQRVAPLLEDLTNDEYTDLWQSVRVVQRVLKKQFPDCKAFNVAVQDGAAAGQSVPHVHVHLLPRVVGDFERNDDVYDEIQNWAPREEMKVDLPDLEVPDDEKRKDRTPQEMTEEAALYRNILESKL